MIYIFHKNLLNNFILPEALVDILEFLILLVFISSITFTSSFSKISDLLTLFSKSFSSFLHSTCSLSTSLLYLALEDSYLHFKAAIPSNLTLCWTLVSKIHYMRLSLSMAYDSTQLIAFPYYGGSDYNSKILWINDYNFELLLVQSPYFGNLCLFFSFAL